MKIYHNILSYFLKECTISNIKEKRNIKRIVAAILWISNNCPQ